MPHLQRYKMDRLTVLRGTLSLRISNLDISDMAGIAHTSALVICSRQCCLSTFFPCSVSVQPGLRRCICFLSRSSQSLFSGDVLMQVYKKYQKHPWYRSERLSLRTMNSVSVPSVTMHCGLFICFKAHASCAGTCTIRAILTCFWPRTDRILVSAGLLPW